MCVCGGGCGGVGGWQLEEKSLGVICHRGEDACRHGYSSSVNMATCGAC